MNIVLRDSAVVLGLPRYFDGKLCRHGHISERYTSNKICVMCSQASNSSYRVSSRQKRNSYSKTYYLDNKERACEYNRAYHMAHRERLIAGYKQYRKVNPEKIMAHCRNRRYRVASSGRHSGDDILEILKLQRHKCAYCRADLKKIKHEVDHIVPVALGGSNDRRNLQILCTSCNRRKLAKHPIAFAQELGRLL